MDSLAFHAFAIAADSFLEVAPAASGQLDLVGLGGWSALELVGHTARSLAAVVEHLDAAVGKDWSPRVGGAGDYYLLSASAPADDEVVAARGREVAQALGAQPLARVRALADAAVARLRAADDDAVVLTPIGMVTVEDYLPTAVVELSVHTCELAAVIGVQAQVLRPVAAVAFSVLGEVEAADSRAEGPLLALSGRGSWPRHTRVTTRCRHWAY